MVRGCVGGFVIAWVALAAAIWAVYASLLGYIGGRAFQDNHAKAFLFAFVAAVSATFFRIWPSLLGFLTLVVVSGGVWAAPADRGATEMPSARIRVSAVRHMG